MESKTFTKRLLSIMFGKAGETLLLIIVTPILVRVLGSGGYGEYAFFLSLYSLLILVYDLGLFDASRKFIAEDPYNREYISEVALSSYIIGILILALCTTSLYLILQVTHLETYFNVKNDYLYIFLIFALIGGQMFRINRSILMGLKLERDSEFLLPLQSFLFGLIAISLAYAGYGINGVFLGFVVALFIVCTISFKVVIKNIYASIYLLKEGLYKRGHRLIKFGIYSSVLVLLFQSLYQVDVIMVQYFMTDVDTGYYKAALQTSEFLWFIPLSLQLILLHSSSNIWVNQDMSKITALSSKLVKYTATITTLMLVCMFVLADSFLEIYFGPEFTTSKHALWILLFGVMGFSIARIIVPIIQGKGNFRFLIVIMIVVATMNAILNFLLIPTRGIVGAAIATSVSYGSMVFIHAYAAKKVGFDPFQEVPWLHIFASGLFVFFIVYPMSLAITNSILKLIIIPPIGFVVYLILIIKLDILRIEEIIDLLNNMPQSIYNKVSFVFEYVIPILKLITGKSKDN